MGCRIAENVPLQRLQRQLGLPRQCHSLRSVCAEGIQRSKVEEKGTLAAAGAVIGYCQALFNRGGDAKEHTELVLNSLGSINAPWRNSHELFYGYKCSDSAGTFVERAFEPLVGQGRVPVLISSLDPARNGSEIAEVLSTKPKIIKGETVLLRVVLQDSDSVNAVASTLNGIVREAEARRSMPNWWLLLQGSLEPAEWKRLSVALGSASRYLNIAANPFNVDLVLDAMHDKVTVAQIPIGLSEGLGLDGTVKLAKGMKISGAAPEASYNLFEYMEKLRRLDVAPTLIVLGPSLPEWTNEMNSERIAKLLPVLRKGCEILWADVPKDRRDYVWKLSA